MKLNILQQLVLLVCLFQNEIQCQHSSGLKTCLEESKHQRICIKDIDIFQNASQTNVELVLFLKEIVEIDENRHSVSIQIILESYWNNPGLSSSDQTR